MQSTRLAPQARPHALAELETAIRKAEANRDRHRLVREHASGDDLRRSKVFLRIAEERLAQLYRSRETLIGGERPDDGEAEAS
jgi:hypothetical protein